MFIEYILLGLALIGVITMVFAAFSYSPWPSMSESIKNGYRAIQRSYRAVIDYMNVLGNDIYWSLGVLATLIVVSVAILYIFLHLMPYIMS